MVETEVVPYYALAFPQGMDWLTGQMRYADTIPAWWYHEASVPFGQQPNSDIAMGSFIADEILLFIAANLENPSRLVLTHRGAWILLQRQQMTVVSMLADQWLIPSRLIRWWGHFVYSRGPPFVPAPRMITETVPPADDFDFLARREARWLEEMEEEGMAGNREQVDQWEWRPPRFEPHAPPPLADDNEIVFWRDSLEAYEQAVLDAQMWGTRVPSGIIVTPEHGTYRLVFSDSEFSEDESETGTVQDTAQL